MLPAKKPAPVGRYSSPGREPANGLGRPVPSQNVRTAVGSVPDPLAPGQRVAVTVNRRVDVLEHEMSHGLISEAAYQAGRSAQRIFERARGPAGSNWQGGDRVDASMASDLAALQGIEDARKIQAFMGFLTRTLGTNSGVPLMTDVRLIRCILGENKSYAEVARMAGQGGTLGPSYMAKRFRHALEAIAEAGAAKGRLVDTAS